jgi:hypothetical protein
MATAEAVAEDPPPSEPPPVTLPSDLDEGEVPGGADVNEKLIEVLREAHAREAELDAPALTQDREDSRHAYTQSDSHGEVANLLRSFFDSELAALNRDPARFLSEATLERKIGQTAARVSKDGEAALLESGAPVVARDEEGLLRKVDLSLEQEGEGFVATNPLVEIEIGDLASHGVSLMTSEGSVLIEPVLGEDEKAVMFGDKNVLYADIGPDRDLLVAPVANGAETFDQLRSPNSPEQLRYDLHLPTGAELVSDGSGGADVVKDDETILHVSFPTAVDAQGTDVPVKLEIDRSSIVLRIDHRAREVAYPILVDPFWELTENWWWYGNSGLGALSDGTWQWGSNVGWIYGSTSCIYACWGSGRGLFVSTPSGGFAANNFGQWTYTPPGATSYVTGADLNPFWRDNHNCSKLQNPEPHDYAGIWEPSGWWPDFEADRANSHGNAQLSAIGRVLVVGLGTGGGGSNPCWRDIMLGGASVWISDPDNPSWNGAPSVSSVWTHNTMLPINVSASDPGLGVKYFNLFTTDGSGNAGPMIGNAVHPCSGLKANPCPSSWSAQITNYSPAALPTGINSLALRASDPLHEVHYSGQAVLLKVDHAPPVIKTSGELLAANPIKYHLEVDAEDGSSASLSTAQSGMKKLEFYLDGAYQGAWPNQSPGNCVNPQQGIDVGSCKFEGVDVDLPRILEGKHTLKITAVDSIGHSTTKIHELQLPKDVTAPELIASGSLKAAAGSWVAAKANPITLEVKDIETGATEATVFVDGKEVVAPATQQCVLGGCPMNQSFSVDLSGYAEGPHTVKALARDGAGNETQSSWTVSVDASVPKLDITTTPVIPSGWTPQLTSPSINFKALDTTTGGNGSGITKVEAIMPVEGGGTWPQALYSSTCKGTAESPCQQEATATKSLSFFSLIAQGTVQLPVKAYDLAGNVSTQTLTLKIDRSAPQVKATGPLMETAAGTLVPGGTKLDLTVTDKGSGVGTVELLLDGTVEDTLTLAEIEADGGKQTCSGETCTLSYSFAPDIGQNLSSGNHTLMIRAKDLANRTGSLSKEVTLDTKAPKLDITTTPVIPSGWTPQLTSPSINFKALDTTTGGNGSGITKVEAIMPVEGGGTWPQALYSSTCKGTAESPCQQEATATKSLSFFSLIAQGTVQLPVKAYDLAGNVSTQTLTLKIDRSAPQVKATGPLMETAAGTLVGSSSKLNLTITDAGSGVGSVELLLDGQVEETITLEEIEADGGKQTCNSAGNCTLTYTFIPDVGHSSPAGKHTLMIRAKDLANRTGSLSKEMTLDTQAPEATLSGPLAEFAGFELEAAEADLKVVATDPGSGFTSGIKWIVIAVDGQQVAALDNCKAVPCAPTGELTYTYKEAEWGSGPHEVQVLITDWVGNTIERQVSVNAPITAIAPECPTGPQETVEAAGVVTPTEASALLAAAMPSATAPTEPSESEPADESPFDPSVAEEGQVSINEQGIDVTGTPTGGGIEDTSAGTFTVGQAICMRPLQKTNASFAPVEVGGDAVIYANTAPETDTVVRPTAFGITIVEHLRGPAAPSSFSWKVELGPGEELRKLANGSVAVVKSGVNVKNVDTPAAVPDLVPESIPDVEAQQLRAGANLAEADNALEGEVTAVVAPPQAVLGNGSTAPALLQINGGAIVTATLPPNVVAETIAMIIEANTAPDPAAMCAHVFSDTPDQYSDGCGEPDDPEAEPDPSPGESVSFEELQLQSSTPQLKADFAQGLQSGFPVTLIGYPDDPSEQDKEWCHSYWKRAIYCAYFYKDKEFAVSKEHRLFNLEETDSTKANAFRHALWISAMVNSDTPDIEALRFAMNHEKGQRNSSNRNIRYKSAMDSLNNFSAWVYAAYTDTNDDESCQHWLSKVGGARFIGYHVNPTVWANQNQFMHHELVYRRKYEKVRGEQIRVRLVSQDCG